MNLLLSVSMLFAAAVYGEGDNTRGIGQYPGSPSEYYAPAVSWTASEQLTNVALHRAAYASSTCDYLHTAHLVTDGISGQADPAVLQVTTPEGRLPRREAEWGIDGGPYSRNVLMGGHTWLQYDWGHPLSSAVCKVKVQGRMAYREGAKGYAIRCEISEDGNNWQAIGVKQGEGLPGIPLQYRLHSDPNKQEAQKWLPAQILDETISFSAPSKIRHFRILFDMDGAAHWDIHELQFFSENGQAEDVMPSREFSSMWMSDGGGAQWLYVDLGKSMPIEKVQLDWFQAPRKGYVEVSDDAQVWRKVADIGGEFSRPEKGRYVRLSLQECGDAGYYALREMKVMAPLQKIYVPHAVAGLQNGRYELSGGNWMLQRASEVSASDEDIASPDYD